MRIVLAYSGSLEGSAAIAWLREQHGAEVVAVTLDLGQGRELEAIRDQALSLGAQRAHVLDTREFFAEQFVLAALRADALHEGGAPMGLALSRPAIAEKLAEIAAIERADAVAHAGRMPESRLDRLLRNGATALPIFALAQSWALTSDDLAAFGRRHGLRVAPAGDHARVESTLWGRSLMRAEAGPESRAAFFASVRAPRDCPDEAATVDISFEQGIPTGINGVPLPLLELIASVDTLAATHGVGRVELDDLLCDAPAAVLLHTAHRALACASMPPDAAPLSAAVSAAYVSLVEDGRWFSPLRDGLDAFLAVMQRRVTGHVRLRLLKGDHTTIATELAAPPISHLAVAASSPARD